MMEEHKVRLFKALGMLAIFATVLVGAKVVTEIKGYRFIGGGVSASNTISVTGDAEKYAAPDIAAISFTAQGEAKKVADAQEKVNTKIKAALAEVRKLGVAEKDIKTDYYNSYPKYDYQEPSVVCMGLNCPPYRPGKQVISGYEVSQQVSLKVRNLDSVPAIIEALGNTGIDNIQGPNFSIDNQDALKAEARKEAIDKARQKAKVLARDLGVSLVRIVSFSEGGYYPMYDRALSAQKAEGAPSVPEIPQGQEKITSQVTLTYEIR